MHDNVAFIYLGKSGESKIFLKFHFNILRRPSQSAHLLICKYYGILFYFLLLALGATM